MKHKQRAWNGRYISLERLSEYALGIVVIGIVSLWHVKDSNNALQSNVERLRGHVVELQVQAGELEIQGAEKNMLLKKELGVKLKAEEVEDKNKVALASLNEYERALIQKESSFRTTAKNPKSSAFGICQLLDYNRVKYAKLAGVENPNTIEAHEQIAMCRQYIAHRYDNAKIALQWHLRHGWY